MLLLSPVNWKDYELIDCGNYKKLERFGAFVLERPEPQAIWDPSLSLDEWRRMADGAFTKDEKSDDKGSWRLKDSMKDQWSISYKSGLMKLGFRLGLSSFKHVGIFPEQASNWDYIYNKVNLLGANVKVLNLFAYTGGASVAARAAGADVTHVDSVKQVISWARDNMDLSKLQDIRWVVEDAMKFVEREVRRGNKYQAIILDPPAYGRGPKGEKWLIDQHLNVLIKACKELLDPDRHFFILNLYSLSFSPLIQETMIRRVFGKVENAEYGELYLNDRYDKKLPLGTFYRFSSK